jgi:hypothetical protein
MDKELGKVIEALGNQVAKQQGQIMGLMQAVSAMLQTRPDPEMIRATVKRMEANSPLPGSGIEPMLRGYDEMVAMIRESLDAAHGANEEP